MESSSNNTREEDLRYTRSSSGHTLKHGESFIQIDSISIDLPNVNSKNEKTTKCEHFSIRKYVSEMRKKDNKVCWPFESDSKSGSAEIELKYPLPPLDIPKFRWWQCQNCLQGICKKENGKAVLVNSLNGESSSNGPSCTHIALTGSETMVLVSNFKQTLKLDSSAEKGEADSDCLVQVTASEFDALLCSDQKEERDCGNKAAIKVPENGLENNVHQELPRPTPNAAANDVSHGQEQGADDAGHQSISTNDEVNDVVNSPRNHRLQRDTSHDCGWEMKAMRSSQTSLVAVDGVNHEPDALTVRQNGHPHDELNYPSSDSAEVGPGYRSRDKPGSLHRRKVRKVRLLSDLLGQNENLNMNNIGREESPLPATSDASEEFGPKKVFLGRKMKRKFPPADECKAVVLNEEASEVGIVKADVEENQKAIAETVEDDAFAKTSPRSVVRSGRTTHGEDINSGLVKKKRKKKKNNELEVRQHEVTEDIVVSGMENDACSLMVPLAPVNTLKTDLTKHVDDGSLRIVTKKKKENELTQESFQNKINESWGRVADDFSLTSSGHGALMGREMGSSFSPVLKTDKKSRMCNCTKKSKMPQGDDDHKERIPQSSSSKLREDSFSGIKFGLVQSGPTAIRFLPDGDGAVKKGTDLSSYRGKSEAKYPLSLDYGPASTILWQQVGPEEGQVRKKNTVSTNLEPNLPSRSRPDEFSKKGVHYNHTSKEPIYSMTFPNEKQRYTSRDMGHFLMPHKEISGAASKGEISGSREQSTVMKNHNNKLSNKASSRGTCSDEMEIVELMAKIQYENSLQDTVTDRTHLDARKSPSYQNMRFGGEHKNGDLNLLLKEGSVGDQAHQKNAKKLSSVKQKAVDMKYSPHMNTSYPVETQVEQNQNQFKGHGVLFSQYQGKPSGSNRDEDTVANNYKKSSGAIEGLSACNTCQIAGPTEEPFRLWSSSTIPIARVPAQTNVHRNSGLQTSGLKSPGFKVSNKSQDRKKGFLLETSSGENSYIPRTNGVKVRTPLGSSDFYSNEKIPALHLLSLMDARSSQNVKGNPRPTRQPSPIPRGYPSSKELDFGAYNASETLRRPSPDYHTINFLDSGKYDRRTPAVPILGSSSSFEPHGNLRDGLMGQVPLKVREKGKQKCSDLVGSIGGSASQKYVPSGGIPVHNQQTDGFFGMSSSVAFPPKFRTVDKPEKEHIRSTTCSVWPTTYSLEMGICTVNRNPAEFSSPEAGNVYTTGGSELRFGKRARALDCSTASIIDLDRPKRGRKKKIAPANNQQPEHHQIL